MEPYPSGEHEEELKLSLHGENRSHRGNLELAIETLEGAGLSAETVEMRKQLDEVERRHEERWVVGSRCPVCEEDRWTTSFP